MGFSENEDEMRVMFVTKDREEWQVRYGEREDMLDDMAVTHVESYESENMCEAPANMSVGWRDPGWIHDGIHEERI